MNDRHSIDPDPDERPADDRIIGALHDNADDVGTFARGMDLTLPDHLLSTDSDFDTELHRPHREAHARNAEPTEAPAEAAVSETALAEGPVAEATVAEAPAVVASDLTSGPIGHTLWHLAIPLAFGFVVNALQSWINMFFVSRLGDGAVAAIGFSDQINLVIFTLGSGFCIGTGIIVARRTGEGRNEEASVVATQAFSFMALYGTLAAIALHFLLPMILPLLNLSGALLADTSTYLMTVMLGLPALMIMFQSNASIRSTGNTVFPMSVAIIVATTNAVLDPLLIFGLAGMPKLGLVGAATATVTAQWLGAIICTVILYSGRLDFRLKRPTLRFDRAIIRSIFALGVPASLQGLSVSVARVILISVANVFGTAAVTAYTIGLRIDVLVLMPIFAMGIAIETLVSQNIGARRFDRVGRFRWTGIRHLGGVIAAMGTLIFLFAGQIAGAFTHDPHVARLTEQYLHIAVFGYIFFAIGHSALRSLSGAGHPLRSLAITCIVLFVIQVPLAYALAEMTSLGEIGLFASIAFSYLIMAAVGSYAVRGTGWMMKRV